MNHTLHMAAGKEVGLQFVAGDIVKPGLVSLNQRGHNHIGRHITDAHQKELDERDVNAADMGAEPQEERHEVKEDRQHDDGCYRNDCGKRIVVSIYLKEFSD